MYTEAGIVADTVARLAARGIISRRESARAIEAVGITRDEFTAAFRVHAEHNRVALPSRATLTVGKPAAEEETSSKAAPRSIEDCQTNTRRISSSLWTAVHPLDPALIGRGQSQVVAVARLVDLYADELIEARATVEVTEIDDTDAAQPLPTVGVPSDDEERERGDDPVGAAVVPDPAPTTEPVDKAPRPAPRRRTPRPVPPPPTPAEAEAYRERHGGNVRPHRVVNGKVWYQCTCGEGCGPDGDGWRPATDFTIRSDRDNGRPRSRATDCHSRYQRTHRVTTSMFAQLNAVGIEFTYDPMGHPVGLSCVTCGEAFVNGDHVSLAAPSKLAHTSCTPD